MIFGWLWCLQAVAEPLHIEVQGLQKEPEAILHVRGESISVPLQSASAQIWTADTDVPWQRFLHLHLRNPVSKETLYRGILERKPGETSIYLGIDNSGEIINEFSSAGTQHRIKKNERNWLLARVAWFALVLAMAAWFFRGSSPILQRKRESHLLSWWSTPLFFLLMSLGWNGTALFRPGVPGLHFDTLGTYWFMSRAQEWSWFVDPLTAWPEGANYGQLDSFVLYGLVHMLGWLSAEYLFKGILLIAPIASAWAASRFAEELGAKRPWSWIAGIAYGFNGLAAATVLEGHVYHLLQPWLPLCAMWWWKSLRNGTKKDAVLAAIFWGLCLLTSAYIGLSASLVIFAFWIGHKGWKQPQSFWGLGVILGIFLLYFSLYRSSPGMSDGRDFNSMMVGALNLGNFFGHRPMIDHSLHSQALGVLAIPLFLAVHAFDILPRRSGRRVLWGTAFLSLSFAFGSFVTLDSLQPIFPLPLFFLGDVPLLGSIGFPVRLAWPFLLCTGVLAAVTISKSHFSRPFLLVVLCATVTEAFVSVQLPWRQYNNPVEIPNVYSQVEGPVLDLYPEVKILGRYSDHLIWFSTMGCFFQSSHGRAISDNCVATDPNKQNRKKMSKWLVPVLMKGDVETAISALEGYGYTSVVVYPDLFTEGDRRRLLHAFYAIDSDPVISENAGMYAMLFRLAAGSPQERTLPESERSVQWGTSVLVDAKNLEFDFFPKAGVTFKPHQLLVDGTSYPLERRRDSPSHFATITGNFDGVSTLQVVSDDVLWEGRFASGASDEQVTVSEEEGFLAVTSVSAQSPASRDIPKWATRSWLFLSVLFGIFHMHRFWQRRWLFRTEKENRAVGL